MISFPNSKINLGLNVIARRQDGFHDIETVMYPVARLFDSLEIIPRDDSAVNFRTGGIETDCPAEHNLVVKAYMLMKNEFNISGADIYLRKLIPSGAGLGGGSADAAFTIKSVNDIFGLRLEETVLEELASRLGSDTSFFIRNVPQFCTGRGEIMSATDLSLKGKHVIIVKPSIGISTAEAYSEITPRKPLTPITEIISRPIHEWKGLLKNDFEEHLFRRYPVLAKLKQDLYHSGALYASMSGSGSALFGIFDSGFYYPTTGNIDFSGSFEL